MNNMNNTNTSAEIYLVLHCYECDGGFGDAISQETIVTAFSSKDKARTYARKWSKRHVYGAPFDELTCGTLRVQKVGVDTMSLNDKPEVDW